MQNFFRKYFHPSNFVIYEMVLKELSLATGLFIPGGFVGLDSPTRGIRGYSTIYQMNLSGGWKCLTIMYFAIQAVSSRHRFDTIMTADLK